MVIIIITKKYKIPVNLMMMMMEDTTVVVLYSTNFIKAVIDGNFKLFNNSSLPITIYKVRVIGNQLLISYPCEHPLKI